MKIINSWDLSDLYNSPNDPQIQKDLSKLQKNSVAFELKHKGKIKVYNLEQIIKLFKEVEKIYVIEYKLDLYSSLLFSLNTSDPAASALSQKLSVLLTSNSNRLIFIELELAKHPKLKEFSLDKSSEPYKIIFQKLLAGKPFLLDYAREELLNIKSVTSSSGWQEMFEKFNSQIEVEIKEKDKIKKVSLEESLKSLYSPDRILRKTTAAAMTQSFVSNEGLYAHIYNMLIINKAQNSELRGYNYPEQGRHIGNGLSKEAVEALESSTIKHYGLVTKYYKLKAKLLKLKSLADYDRYAPVDLKANKKKYSLSQAADIVNKSFNSFDPEFSKVFGELSASAHIDALHRKGKHGGAYCAYSPFGPSYILLNYFGHARDVETLAHESGHAIHNYFAKKLPLSVAHPPLVLAETASVFGEMLVFEELLKNTVDKQDKITLIAAKIEESIATIFRQISMYRFEKLVHNYAQKNSQVPAEKLREFWRITQVEMFGDSLEITKEYDYWWMYVSHFYATPFYVYAYAFGGLLVSSLYQAYKIEGASFIPKYKNFLAAGGSKLPQEAVDIFGYDLQKENFWDKGFVPIERLIEELEMLC
jgi:oligoendopeptidase F